MMVRADLPPVSREFDKRLGIVLDVDHIDEGTAAAMRQLGGLILNALTELENDLIIHSRTHDR